MSVGFINGNIDSNGVTNGSSAAAGEVGEFVSSIISTPIGVTNGVASDLTSLTLTAGDWDVWGNCNARSTVPAAIASLITVFSTVSATFGNNWDRAEWTATGGVCTVIALSTPRLRISISSPQTFYSVAAVGGGGSLTIEGNMFARRVR